MKNISRAAESCKNSPDMSGGSGGLCVKRVQVEQVDKIGQTSESVASPQPRPGVPGPGHQGGEDVLVTEAAPEQQGQVPRVPEVTRRPVEAIMMVSRAPARAGETPEADEAGHVLAGLGELVPGTGHSGHSGHSGHVTVITLCHACHAV